MNSDSVIIRTLPSFKSYIKKPNRFDFDTYLKLKNDTEFNDKYSKLNKGINFMTNKSFSLNNKENFKILRKQITSFPYEYYEMLYSTNTNIASYIKETHNIYNKIIKENKKIDNYNENVIIPIHDKIIKLKNWNDYVLYNNKKYGLPKIIKIENEYIHKQHNCNGIIEFYKYENCNCTVCNIFQYYGCGDKEKRLYKCSKCNSIQTIQ